MDHKEIVVQDSAIRNQVGQQDIAQLVAKEALMIVVLMVILIVESLDLENVWQGMIVMQTKMIYIIVHMEEPIQFGLKNVRTDVKMPERAEVITAWVKIRT